MQQGNDQAIAKLQQQVRALQMQLMGNNPSTNFIQYIPVGGTISGWFQLVNNGINTTVNSNDNSVTGNPTSFVSSNVATGETIVLDPTDIVMFNPTGIAIDISSGGGLGAILVTDAATPAGYVQILGNSRTITLTDGVHTVVISPTGITGLGGVSHTVALAKLTGGGSNGSITFTNGVATAIVDPT